MAIKHVKEYYKQVEKMYFDLKSSLIEMENEFKKGEVTEEELNKLLLPVQGIQQNYFQLSYVLSLLYRPNKEEKAKKYDEKEDLVNRFFNEKRLTKEQVIADSENCLMEFKKALKEGLFKDEQDK